MRKKHIVVSSQLMLNGNGAFFCSYHTHYMGSTHNPAMHLRPANSGGAYNYALPYGHRRLKVKG